MLCVSWCPFLRVASGLVWCRVSSCRVVSWPVVLSCCVLVRWVGIWCVASGIVLRLCALLLVGLSRCVACCLAHRCLVVGCGLVFLVVGFVGVCYVSALRGVVLRFVGCAPLLCHVGPLGYVVLCGLVWLSLGFVVACSWRCCVVPCCVVVSGVVWCWGMCGVSVRGLVALLCGVVRLCELFVCVRDIQRYVMSCCRVLFNGMLCRWFSVMSGVCSILWCRSHRFAPQGVAYHVV